MAMAMVVDCPAVTGGVDTHLDVHVAAALDRVGGLLGVEQFPASSAGYGQLREWLAGFGPVMRVGVEGTGSYGAGLTRALQVAGIEVVEIDRPNRQARRRQGKSDPLDAVEAARAALAGRGVGVKARNGNVEAIRALLVARRSTTTVRTKTLNQIRHLSYCAPEQLREQLAGVPARRLGATAAAFRPRRGGDAIAYATKTSLALLGRRVVALEREQQHLDGLLEELVAATAPGFLAVHGVGVYSAAILLVTAGDNPQRLRSEAAWAHLCGVAPIPASSGKVVRMRLNTGGDRLANHALWRIRHGAHERRRTHPRLRATPTGGRPFQTRDHARAQTLRRP